MTEQQIAKKENRTESGDIRHDATVILNDRFVHRDNSGCPDNNIFLAEPDAVIAHLAAHFMLNKLNSCALPDGIADAESTMDDMPRFQQSLRDGLQVPKEG